MNFLSLIFPQTVYKTTSKFSGEIKVIDHTFERRMVVGGLTQSGGITKRMWEKALSRSFPIRSAQGQDDMRSVLILGLGAGTVAKVISEKFPTAKIVGVEIDPAIIDVGKKYFDLNTVENLEIFITDALEFKSKKKFDLIIVDLYKGKNIEKNVRNESFLKRIAQNLAKNGIVIFNVVAIQNDNSEARIFLDNLKRIFKDNLCKRIIVNNFFFCTNPFTKGGELSMAKKKKKKKK